MLLLNDSVSMILRGENRKREMDGNLLMQTLQGVYSEKDANKKHQPWTESTTHDVLRFLCLAVN